MRPSKNSPLRHLPTLKMKLISATDFSEVFTYFFDHLGENDQFLRMGESIHHKLLETVLAHTAKQVMQTDVIVIQQAFFISLPEQRFVHGGCHINRYLVNFIYFEDIDAGMIAMAPPPYKDETQFARFSCQQVGSKKSPSAN